MKPYLISLALGLAAGMLYGAFNVRSPAPPIIALLGLLGILVGEQIPHLVRNLAQGRPVDLQWVQSRAPRLLGVEPPRTVAVSRSDPPA